MAEKNCFGEDRDVERVEKCISTFPGGRYIKENLGNETFTVLGVHVFDTGYHGYPWPLVDILPGVVGYSLKQDPESDAHVIVLQDTLAELVAWNSSDKYTYVQFGSGFVDAKDAYDLGRLVSCTWDGYEDHQSVLKTIKQAVLHADRIGSTALELLEGAAVFVNDGNGANDINVALEMAAVALR